MSVKSYFAPEVIKTFKSDFNTKVQLIDFSGQLRLDMGDLTQSGQVIEKIWSKAFKKLIPPKFIPKKVLILGLGAGSVTKVIARKWSKAEVLGIEIDPVVIKIAKEYFKVDKIKNLKVLNQDAQKFVKANQDRFDLVLVDCYQGYKIPPIFEDPKFLKKLKSKGQVVLVNRLFWDGHKLKTLKFLEKLNKSFSTLTCRTPSNLVISIS
jgi:spermidine synthase